MACLKRSPAARSRRGRRDHVQIVVNDCEVKAHLAVVRLADIRSVEIVDVRAGVVDGRVLREPREDDSDEAAVLRRVEEEAQVQCSFADGAAPMVAAEAVPM